MGVSAHPFSLWLAEGVLDRVKRSFLMLCRHWENVPSSSDILLPALQRLTSFWDGTSFFGRRAYPESAECIARIAAVEHPLLPCQKHHNIRTKTNLTKHVYVGGFDSRL